MTERDLKLLAMAQDERTNENERFSAFKKLCASGALANIVDDLRRANEIISLTKERDALWTAYRAEKKAKPASYSRVKPDDELERLRRKTMPIAERDAEVVRLYADDAWPMQKIADWFGMSKANVHRIIKQGGNNGK